MDLNNLLSDTRPNSKLLVEPLPRRQLTLKERKSLNIDQDENDARLSKKQAGAELGQAQISF